MINKILNLTFILQLNVILSLTVTIFLRIIKEILFILTKIYTKYPGKWTEMRHFDVYLNGRLNST